MKRLSRGVVVIVVSNLIFSSFGFAADGRETPAAGAVKVIQTAVPLAGTVPDLKAGTEIPLIKAGDLASPGTIVPAILPETAVPAPAPAAPGGGPGVVEPVSPEAFGKIDAAMAALTVASVEGPASGDWLKKLDQVYDGERPAGPIDFETTLDGQRLKIRVMGEATITPKENPGEPVHVIDHVYDRIVGGMGWAGISAAWGLRAGDNLHLEREPFTGGLAYGGVLRASDIEFVRGAAYITKPTGVVAKIWKSMGEPPIKTIAIKEPIDSRIRTKAQVLKDWQDGTLAIHRDIQEDLKEHFDGKLASVKGVWEPASLDLQDPGFTGLYKELTRLEEEGFTDFNPPERAPKKAEYLDNMTAYEFLKPYGPQVVDFLDSYCQSALGGHLDQVSALAFVLFYVDELVTRYTWAKGTGGGIYEVAHKLASLHKNTIRTRTHIREAVNGPDGLVHVTFERDGKVYKVRARDVVLAVPSRVAAKIVPQMPEEQRKAAEGLEYAHYVVSGIKGTKDINPDSYDTWKDSIWFRQPGVPVEKRRNNPFTDFIASFWTRTQGFTKDVPQDVGMIAMYQPKAPPFAANAMAPLNVVRDLITGVMKMRENVPALAKEKELSLEAYRWPFSIHQAKPGHLTRIGPILEQSVGNIHFAHNNQGTPAFETAMLEGYARSQKINQALSRRAKAFWLRQKDRPSSWKPMTRLEVAVVEDALPWAIQQQPRRAAEFKRRLKALERPALAEVSDRVLPEDHTAWVSLKDGDRAHLYVRVDSLALNAAVREALAKGASEKSLYRQGSKAHRLAQRLLAPVEKAAAGLEKEGLKWAANYNFNAAGSTILVEFAGTKGQIMEALQGSDIYKAWLGNGQEALPGNELYMRDQGAYQNAVTGVSTVYLRKGADKGYRAGPGQIKNAAGELLPVTFESVEEVPYSKIGTRVLNGLSAGLTWKEMFATMESYYPDFAAEDVVTVIRYRRR
ncbi:MAG: FAD-dependent oxidoreductase [Elusimicrobia bacterium]|nr:FAD-dependent oxidoreductase [Elusimicrobiota bacterium]